jgi:PAS domain-containing protein
VWPPDLLITEALTQRPRRSQDLPAEVQAMHELAQQVATRSARVLDRLAELAVKLCDAGSAGVSLLEESPAGETAFRWVALAGALESYVGGSTPRDHSPCGICLDRNEPVLLSRPSRVFEYFNEATPRIVEGLLLPLHDEAGRPFGTIWIVSHEEGRGFDAGTVETMTRLASFARLIHTVERDIAQRKQFEEALRASEARLTSRRITNYSASVRSCSTASLSRASIRRSSTLPPL